ncbi:DUF4132 domain-containing protein [Paucibacter sp. R3-3]|uniref:DUF4132 domain-containing protein n=1 Tax=Roseateles agri TaxID=3098619 RepID=A0ABU5DHJ3_9BURK|nr:DUF4132 domain-containing protein [Paucibacter sp. R3-3]MDY0745763.1 DUF4132 domain-containing protein [Paucibacter sp. R3-3]
MLGWISSLLGGQSAVVPDDIPRAWVEQLQARVAPLGAELSRDTLSFVLHGEPPGVLARLASEAGTDAKLGLTGFADDKTAAKLYEHFDQVPATLALRWAQVLESASSQGPGSCRMTFERGVHWPELLLVHSSGWGLNTWGSRAKPAQGLTAQRLESMCVADGLSPAAWLLGGFQLPSGRNFFGEQRPLMLTDLPGYPDALLRHATALASQLLPATLNGRLHALKMIASAPTAALDYWAPQIAELASSNSKQVRAAVEPLLARAGVPVIDELRRTALHGKPDARLQALRALFNLARTRDDQPLESFLRESAGVDKAPAVQALLVEWDSQISTPAKVSYDYEVPVIDWRAESNAVAPDVQAKLWSEANIAIEKSNTQSREHHAKGKALGRNWPLRLDECFKDADAQALARVLAVDVPEPNAGKLSPANHNARRFLGPALLKLVEGGHFTPVALVKTMWVLGFIDGESRHVDHFLASCVNKLHVATGRPSLLELAEILRSYDYSPERILHSYCSRWGSPLASGWPDSDVWPFVAQHQDLVARMLRDVSTNDWWFSRAGLFQAIATLPAPLPELVNLLFELALGSAKVDRALAQEALKNQPDKESRIIAALESGKAEVRMVAAQWLARLRHEPAVAALERAVRKEKQDVAKGAMLDALQLLGQPVEIYLDRESLARDAAKLLAKGLPKDLDWFPWAALPAVHWVDTGAAVTPEVLQWLITQACKQKSPEPNAVLRKLCSLIVPREREALGQFVLETWMAEDVRSGSPDEAAKQALSSAQSQWNSVQAYQQYYQGSPMLQMSVEQIAAQMLPGLLRQPIGSAIGSKGLLAVAAACCAERAAPPAQRYLKEWYGTRASQGKALIAMLAWIEHPSATQLMLSIGSRFRTKSFQEEASRQAEALAERKGWSLAELADRTIPSAGFDETGTQTLSYGSRQFTAQLLPDFKIELFNPEGRKIAALPDSRQDDDEAQAKDAKKALSAARKELKSIVELQADRLYEALCTARDWPVADWSDYLLRHPVLRHLVQRLVWIQTLEDGSTRSFRPLDDGSLTDVNDDPVELASGARVRLAHDSLLEAEAAGTWQQHLVDYAVKPLFQQFGKGRYVLPADRVNATEVTDFQGHLLEAFALRGRAAKLGYTRGNTEDGGWFYTYEKRFTTLGLMAVIEFTGNGLPEENRTIALRHLSFSPTGAGDRWSRSSQPLSKVPQVLLSECYDDLRLMAADGSGFDPEWEKKSEY